jgi:nicotinamide-nucleotide amidase
MVLTDFWGINELHRNMSQDSVNQASVKQLSNKQPFGSEASVFQNYEAVVSEAYALGRLLAESEAMISCAESCTGGLIASALTEISGSSAWFDRGFVTYTNKAKAELVGVPAELLIEHGAVSEPVVCAMAQGALVRSTARLAIAVTGVAGPSGGSVEKPVGTVWLAWAFRKPDASVLVISKRMLFSGDRKSIRLSTAGVALVEAKVLWQQHQMA